jgi:hypothetical protein
MCLGHSRGSRRLSNGSTPAKTLHPRKPSDSRAIGSPHHLSPLLCGLWTTEARWISALVSGRSPSPFLRASFSIFRVKVCRGCVQVVVAEPRAIRSPGLNLISAATSRGLWEWCGLRGFRRAVGIFGSSRSFIGSFSFFFVFGTYVVFLTRSTTSRLQPTTLCRLREERQRWRVIDTVWRFKMKDFSRILL